MKNSLMNMYIKCGELWQQNSYLWIWGKRDKWMQLRGMGRKIERKGVLRLYRKDTWEEQYRRGEENQEQDKKRIRAKDD